jgi:hypothetical protein
VCILSERYHTLRLFCKQTGLQWLIWRIMKLLLELETHAPCRSAVRWLASKAHPPDAETTCRWHYSLHGHVRHVAPLVTPFKIPFVMPGWLRTHCLLFHLAGGRSGGARCAAVFAFSAFSLWLPSLFRCACTLPAHVRCSATRGACKICRCDICICRPGCCSSQHPSSCDRPWFK